MILVHVVMKIQRPSTDIQTEGHPWIIQQVNETQFSLVLAMELGMSDIIKLFNIFFLVALYRSLCFVLRALFIVFLLRFTCKNKYFSLTNWMHFKLTLKCTFVQKSKNSQCNISTVKGSERKTKLNLGFIWALRPSSMWGTLGALVYLRLVINLRHPENFHSGLMSI